MVSSGLVSAAIRDGVLRERQGESVRQALGQGTYGGQVVSWLFGRTFMLQGTADTG